MGSNDRILLRSDTITEDESTIWKTRLTANHGRIALRICQEYEDRYISEGFSSEATIVDLRVVDITLLAPESKAEAVTRVDIRKSQRWRASCKAALEPRDVPRPELPAWTASR
ncbi:hypothetical protein A0H81_10336 [Grifola frondosa]|uniref:Uncharacterized protein n=1 Tax=Grifola frondosa TaxID=5627 RepID=A0A1C7LY83_GRIFR|nr:hypothetical protein A0H81_10336 [Grifola frondosa]